MLMPGIGEAYISPTIRLGLALLVSLVMVPALIPVLPQAPGSILGLGLLLAAEIIVGALIGLLCRLMLSAMHMAGTIISMQSGLSAAMMFDTTQAAQGTLLGNLLSMTSLAFWFALDFHHLMLSALFDSYSLFEAGTYIHMGDTSTLYARMMVDAFSIALRISGPILLVMTLLNFAGGLLSRLMPAMQIFYLLIPIQLMLTFYLLHSLADGFFGSYLEYVESGLTRLLNQ